MPTFESPIPLSEIESVLAWVDTFKLSRPTKKINRDFSDAVLLAEILGVHYPKLVEMHNYPPRNSHALKLNNWMTLNRKVLKKLKLNLCCETMEQLANSATGCIERVLVMVRDKIRRDEEMNKSLKEGEQNVSSGGSYYESCGDEDHVLVVPVKTRVNGVLETVQLKVVNYEGFLAMKEELKDAKDSTDTLKQKVEHLDNLMKLKDERIDELQKQLERKQTRRKEAEAYQNILSVPFDTIQPTPKPSDSSTMNVGSKTSIVPEIKETNSKVKLDEPKESKIPIPKTDSVHSIKAEFILKTIPSKSRTEIVVEDNFNEIKFEIDKVKSDVFKEAIIDEKIGEELDEFKDSVTNVEETIQKEIKEIIRPKSYVSEMSYIN